MKTNNLPLVASLLFLFTPIIGFADTQPMPNAQMAMVLVELAALNGKPVETLSAKEARKQPSPADAVMALLKKQGKSTKPEEVFDVDNTSFSTTAGSVPTRVYSPKGGGPFPLIVYIHGGGWVIADLDTYDATPRALSNLTHSVVVSLEYPKAPEHKFPAAHEAMYAATQYVFENAASLKGDASKVAIVGESAGKNMAAAIGMMARDRKGKMPIHQVLVYPVTNNDMMTASYRLNEDAKPLNKPMMKWFFDQTLNSSEDANNHYLTILQGDLKALPPTTIISAEIDPLMSEGKEFSQKLEAAGVNVSYKLFPGVTHEFFGMSAVLDDAKSAQEFAGEDLNEAFSMKQSK